MKTSEGTGPTEFSLINNPSAAAYPMASFVYIIVNVTLKEDVCQSAMELYRYIEWFLTSPAALTKTTNLDMVPLTDDLISFIKNTILHRFTCMGKSVREMVEKQIHDELESLKTWKLPVIISSVVAGIFFIFLIFCLVHQKYMYIKKASVKKWNVDFSVLSFKAKNKTFFEMESPKMIKMSEKSSKELEVWNVIMRLDEDYMEATLAGREARLLEVDMFFNRANTAVTEKLNSMLLLSHNNITSFIGFSTSPTGQTFFLEDICSKACITRLLCHPLFKVGASLRYSIAREVCSGLMYLHLHKINLGVLHIHQCLIDFRWTTKISQWPLYQTDAVLKRNSVKKNEVSNGFNFFEAIKFQTLDPYPNYFNLWVAPEFEQIDGFSSEKADIYSFGILLCSIFSIIKDEDSFNLETDKHNSPHLDKLSFFHPHSQNLPPKVLNLVNLCTNTSSYERPTLDNVQAALKAADPKSKMSVLDHVINFYENRSSKV